MASHYERDIPDADDLETANDTVLPKAVAASTDTSANFTHLTLLDLTVRVVTSSPTLMNGDVSGALREVYATLSGLGTTAVPQAARPPKLTKKQIEDSIHDDRLFCFEDSRRYRTLKRTLSKHGLTPKQYREKWGLPDDYPMVAPAYSRRRSELAKSNGLGTRR